MLSCSSTKSSVCTLQTWECTLRNQWKLQTPKQEKNSDKKMSLCVKASWAGGIVDILLWEIQYAAIVLPGMDDLGWSPCLEKGHRSTLQAWLRFCFCSKQFSNYFSILAVSDLKGVSNFIIIKAFTFTLNLQY